MTIDLKKTELNYPHLALTSRNSTLCMRKPAKIRETCITKHTGIIMPWFKIVASHLVPLGKYLACEIKSYKYRHVDKGKLRNLLVFFRGKYLTIESRLVRVPTSWFPSYLASECLWALCFVLSYCLWLHILHWWCILIWSCVRILVRITRLTSPRPKQFYKQYRDGGCIAVCRCRYVGNCKWFRFRF